MQMSAQIVDSIRWKARRNYWKVLVGASTTLTPKPA